MGDIFGAPLAIEGMMAFFLEGTLLGLFFFGWDRISPAKHMLVTWFLALATSLSALWILIANAWMQNPVGAALKARTMRMEVTREVGRHLEAERWGPLASSPRHRPVTLPASSTVMIARRP